MHVPGTQVKLAVGTGSEEQSESEGVAAEQEPSHWIEPPLVVMPQEFGKDEQYWPWFGEQTGGGSEQKG